VPAQASCSSGDPRRIGHAVTDGRLQPFLLRRRTGRRVRMNLLYIILIIVLVLVVLGFIGGRGRW
jgi:hypothetical protein